MRRAWLCAAAVLMACHDHHGGHEHGASHGHDEAAHGHEEEDTGHHHESGARAITRFSERAELFVEVPPLSVEKPVELAAHVTRLSDWSPLAQGTLSVSLSGGGKSTETFRAKQPATPGIFRPIVEPRHAAKRDVEVTVKAPGFETRFEFQVTVHADAHAAAHAARKERFPGGVAFLKEQQWRMPFASQVARERPLRPSFEAYGTIIPRAAGEAYVTPPVAGRVRTSDDFPTVGTEVEQNRRLATLTPRLADQGDLPALRQAVARARIGLNQARAERKRVEGLFDDGAVPERRVIDARFEEEKAEEQLQTSRLRLNQSRRVQGAGGAGGSFELRAPLAGTVVSVTVAPGSFVEQGEKLFRIVDLDQLWLHAHVAEAHSSLLDEPHGVWFEVAGFDESFEVGPDGIVTVGSVVDEQSRTLPLLVRVSNPEHRLRVGMFADVHVITDEPKTVVAVPVGAVLHQEGLPVVYVQLGGETFERRIVETGVRDGGYIEIASGIEPGERVVSKGAYAVRLATSLGQVPGHGHHH